MGSLQKGNSCFVGGKTFGRLSLLVTLWRQMICLTQLACLVEEVLKESYNYCELAVIGCTWQSVIRKGLHDDKLSDLPAEMKGNIWNPKDSGHVESEKHHLRLQIVRKELKNLGSGTIQFNFLSYQNGSGWR